MRSRTVPFSPLPGVRAASLNHLAAKQVGGRSGFALTSLVMQTSEYQPKRAPVARSDERQEIRRAGVRRVLPSGDSLVTERSRR